MKRTAAAVLAAVLAPAVALYGWGHEGHRIVADIAQERLTEVTKRNVQSLIGNNTLASVANWADQIRPERDETYNWHFVDIPKDASGFSDLRDCYRPEDTHKGAKDDHQNCVVDRIEYFRRVLGNKSLSRDDRIEALKFLVHFVGDIHQPFHAIGAAKGGNLVHITEFGSDRCGRYPCNLHSAWDSGLIEHTGMDEEAYVVHLDELIFQEHLRASGNAADWVRSLPLSTLRNPCQIEKDERFWTAACWLNVFYGGERTRVLSELMCRCFGDQPPLKRLRTWTECFDGELCLYFEARLPSPTSYKTWLRQSLFERNLIPYVLRAASRNNNRDFEGATHVDALLLNPRNGFSLLVEAKVLSDISCQVSFDIARNQIARTVDVMLDRNPGLAPPLCGRAPEDTLFVLQSPAIFKANPHVRLYGWLLENYRNLPSALGRDLPHRGDFDWGAVAARLGWLTWEDCEAVLPGSCRWLAREPAPFVAPMEVSESTATPSFPETLPYTLNPDFDTHELESLIADFESAVKRAVDRSLSQKLRQELLESDPPRMKYPTLLQLSKWCNTNTPLYWDGMDVARKISQLLFGCVVDRHKLGV